MKQPSPDSLPPELCPTSLAGCEGERSEKQSIRHAFIKGSVAGTIEVLVDQPWQNLKLLAQRGEKLTLNPCILYRGTLVNAGSMTPVTAIQVGLDWSFRHYLFPQKTDISNTERIGSAFVAGVGSSFVSCPAEQIVTYQNKAGGNFIAAGRYLVSMGSWPVFWKALQATAMREGIFASFFLAGKPIIENRLDASYGLRSFIASLSAGLSAAVLSQPFDTIKTRQQTTHSGFADAAKQIYRTQGPYGFFRGGMMRGIGVASAIYVMTSVNEKMDELLSDPASDSLENSLPKVKK